MDALLSLIHGFGVLADPMNIVYMCIGVVLGVALGLALDDMALGIAMGIAIGAGLSMT